MRCNALVAIAVAPAFGLLFPADSRGADDVGSPTQQAFQESVAPVFAKCRLCHDTRLATGGLNIETLESVGSLVGHREVWEKILQKVASGEMPPRGVDRPENDQVRAFVAFVEAAFDRADTSAPADPGRVTARRLNRSEYSRTIRDLLGIEFRAEHDFPTDDSGYGFDNIGDVLTISPVLLEKYISAAEAIAASAIGANPLPETPIESEYHTKDKTIQRIDVSTIEARHRVQWDGEYIVRIGLPGERPKDAAPVTMGFWMDGKLLATKQVETKPSGLVYFSPFSIEELRLYLPAGDHDFRAAFIDDPFPYTLSEKDRYSRNKNKLLESITFVGPFPTDVEPESRKKILFCDPESGRSCVERIIATLARRAYRRMVTPDEVAALMQFFDQARAEGLDARQGVQLAVQALLVSPHFLFRIEHDPDPHDPNTVHRVSDFELASRLSYFLWSSMPDDELLDLAENGRLSSPEALDAQVQRMLEDERSSALAANFAGQWLETRALDSANPDPEAFPAWSPELREDMKEETRLFFEAVLRENLPISTFLDADFTFLNPRLARHYGLKGVAGSGFRRVNLGTEQRGGVLGQAAVLTVTSYPTRTSPVIRGKYVLETILGAPPPDPPDDVPVLPEEALGADASLRQLIEQHRANPACAVCHDRMDALGFGLENYDAIGRWRTRDGNFEVDSTGVLPDGRSFNSPAEMRRILLADIDEFSRNLTEKMLIYALGRGLEPYDRITVRSVSQRVREAGYAFQTLIHEVVRSLPFRHRRGEARQVAVMPTGTGSR